MVNFGDLTKAEKLALMEAWVDGSVIEASCDGMEWGRCEFPSWYSKTAYRVKPRIPDSVRWDIIAPKYKYCARDENSSVYLYTDKPNIGNDREGWGAVSGNCVRINDWNGHIIYLYAQGDVSWQDSLIERSEP